MKKWSRLQHNLQPKSQNLRVAGVVVSGAGRWREKEIKNSFMKTIRIYSDESRHKNERFLLLGGLWVEEENVNIVEKGIKKLRQDNGYINSNGKQVNFSGEFKWTKISDKYLELYKKLIDNFFEWIEKDVFRLCIMLVDTQSQEVLSYSNVKKEGYFKLLYQLYFHNSKIPAIYKIYPDSIKNPTQDMIDFAKLDECLEKSFLKKFMPMLNSTDQEEIKNRERGFVNNITPTNSKNSEFIQLVDVVMGGIGYFQNRLFEKENAKKSKIELMKYINNKMLYSGYIKFEGKSFLVAKSTKFNIWLFKPRNKKSPF